MIRTSLALAFVAATAAGQALAQTPGPILLEKFMEWTAAAQQNPRNRVCFAYAVPKSSEPKGVSRDEIFFYISHRPGDGVKNEVSVKIGYPFRENSTPVATISGQTFEMYVQNDTAWLVNAADEVKLIEAMRRGRDIVIKGTSRRGTTTTDTFSLAGISAALDRIALECK